MRSIIIIQLIYALLVLLFFRASSIETTILSMGLMVVSSLFLGKLYGLISGLFLALLHIYCLAFIHIRPAAFSLSILPAIMSKPDWLMITMMPAIGFVTGLIADGLGVTNKKYEQKISDLIQSNAALKSNLAKYEGEFSNISRERLDQSSWETLLGGNRINEKLSGALLASVTANDLLAKEPGSNPSLMVPRMPDASLRLFDLLVQARPDVLAIMEMDGTIIRRNEKLLAVYGFNTGSQQNSRNILEYIMPEDAQKASENFSMAVHSELKRNAQYRIRTSDGGYSRLLLSPMIVFEWIGSPLSLVACISHRSINLSSYGQDSSTSDARMINEVYSKELCCLSPNHQITYMGKAAADTLGRSPEYFLGMEFRHLIHRSMKKQFESFLFACQKGEHTLIEIEMLPCEDVRNFYRIEAFPAMGATGHYLGTTLLLDDISSMKLIEESLQHRLSLEKMISSISTRFISMDADNLDDEIIKVLRAIGDFEEVIESYVEIYPTKRIKQPAKFKVANGRKTDEPPVDNGGDSLKDTDRFETVVIPISIDGESMGFFRFCQERYHNKWLENDTELIRLIGEIIINALIRKENELNIKLNESRLATTLHSIGDAVIATDQCGQIVLMNQTAEKLTGWRMDEAIDQPIEKVYKPYKPLDADSNDDSRVSERYRFSDTDQSMLLDSLDGKQFYVSSNQSKIQDQNEWVYGEVTVFRDVTRAKKENDEIRYISFHDKLTGLYNRAFFEEELVRMNTKRQYPLTIIIGDCNGLKITNDIFGHLVGDKLLQTIADILKKATRHEDFVARWGGDEFAIILPKTDLQEGIAIQERILKLCSEAPSDPIQPSLAMGSAANTEAGIAPDDFQALLKLAEDRMYRHKLMEGKSARNTLLMSIKNMLFEKSCETQEHANRLKEISERFGRAIGLSSFEQEELCLLSILHDVGKVGIPDVILMKPERLNDEEWGIMRQHSEKGYHLAKSTPELKNIADYILHHHERWDGGGYPAGLKGDAIPKLSRILSLIDSYDVMTHSRVYKAAQSKIDALNEIANCAGSQFDPHLADEFIKIMMEDENDCEETDL